jgi:hypothetical protein
MNTVERLHIYSLSSETFLMNETYVDMHNPIFNLIKEHYTFEDPIPYPPPTNLIAALHPPLPRPPLPTVFLIYRTH